MKSKRLICTAVMAMSCFTGLAAAQDFDRRGPNVMPAPHGNGNYSNNTNTYNHSAAQERRGPNVMPGSQSNAQERTAPRAERPAAPVEREQAKVVRLALIYTATLTAALPIQTGETWQSRYERLPGVQGISLTFTG